MNRSVELDEIDEALVRLKHDLIGLKVELKFRKLARSLKAGFDPDQPRDEFGMWSDGGGVDAPEESTPSGNQVEAVFADLASIPLATRMEQVLGNANDNTADPFLQTIGATITYDTARTGIPTIDETTEKLSASLIKAMDGSEFIPNQTPQAYGVAVHASFAGFVKADDLPGIGREGVEQSFLLKDVVTYGVAGSVRTDVTLRDIGGDVIAIYDVKTGGAVLSASRADELRAHTGAAPNVPVIELHFYRGSSLKHEQVAQNIRFDPTAGARRRDVRAFNDHQAHQLHCTRLLSRYDAA